MDASEYQEQQEVSRIDWERIMSIVLAEYGRRRGWNLDEAAANTAKEQQEQTNERES